MSRFDVIAFDADDTLWQTERLYLETQARYLKVLEQYHSREWILERLYQTQMRNLDHFGYGIKAFTLSMIETAIELTEGRITGAEIGQILEAGRTMLTSDIELLEHVTETLSLLSPRYPLMLLTKGDLRDQQLKIARSGLQGYFHAVEIVSDKNPAEYSALLKRHAVKPARFLMIGNSLRSDILPVLAVGGTAVYVPHALTWSHEMVDPPPPDQRDFYELEHLGLLPELLAQLEQEASAAT